MTEEELEIEKLRLLLVGCGDISEDLQKEATKAIKHGYRKQKKAEWYVNYMESKNLSNLGRVIHYETYTCSGCGKSNGRRKTNYCPACGANMKGD